MRWWYYNEILGEEEVWNGSYNYWRKKKNRFLAEGKFEFIMKGHLDLFRFVEKLLCPQLLRLWFASGMLI